MSIVQSIFPNSSIKRLRFAFVAMAGLTVLGLVGGGVTFAYNHLIQKRFLTDAAPLLADVERLSRVAVRFTATTQELQTIKTMSHLGRVLTEHRLQRDALQSGLLDLAKRRTDINVVEELKKVVHDLETLETPHREALRMRIEIGNRLVALRRELSEESLELAGRLSPSILEASLRMIDLVRSYEDRNEETVDRLSKTLNEVQLLTEISFGTERFLEAVVRNDVATSGFSPLVSREVIAPEFRKLTQLAFKLDNPDQRQVLAESLNVFNEKTLESGGIADQSLQLGEIIVRLDRLSQEQIQLVTRMTDLVDGIVRNAEDGFSEGASSAQRSSLVAVVSLTAISILALVSVVWIGWRLINRDIARRLEHLATSTIALAEGDLNVQVDRSGHDELADMARAVEIFRQNALELRRSEADLSARASELERSNRELDDFAYIASHDLKEPLRATYNHARFLLDDYEDRLEDDGKKRLQRLIALSKRMEKLIADLLYYSRLGRGEEALETLDLHAMIDDISADLAEMLAARNARVSISSSLPAIEGHRPHVTALFRNLISNGVKYNDADEKVIEIGHVPDEHDDAFDTVYVKDNGIGIEEAFSDEIFRIFKRLNSETTYGEGTGVGLSFVKKIIEGQGGRIWLTSKPGEGTTFFFTLRRSNEHANAEASRNAA